jgi:hypothetical protein
MNSQFKLLINRPFTISTLRHAICHCQWHILKNVSSSQNVRIDQQVAEFQCQWKGIRREGDVMPFINRQWMLALKVKFQSNSKLILNLTIRICIQFNRVYEKGKFERVSLLGGLSWYSVILWWRARSIEWERKKKSVFKCSLLLLCLSIWLFENSGRWSVGFPFSKHPLFIF